VIYAIILADVRLECFPLTEITSQGWSRSLEI